MIVTVRGAGIRSAPARQQVAEGFQCYRRDPGGQRRNGNANEDRLEVFTGSGAGASG